jgi:serine/threonine protein kinase
MVMDGWSTDMMRVLGRGGFGKVNAVKNRIDGNMYALKSMAKNRLASMTLYYFITRCHVVIGGNDMIEQRIATILRMRG